MLSVVLMNVIVLSVIMLSVIAPFLLNIFSIKAKQKINVSKRKFLIKFFQAAVSLSFIQNDINIHFYLSIMLLTCWSAFVLGQIFHSSPIFASKVTAYPSGVPPKIRLLGL